MTRRHTIRARAPPDLARARTTLVGYRCRLMLYYMHELVILYTLTCFSENFFLLVVRAVVFRSLPSALLSAAATVVRHRRR